MVEGQRGTDDKNRRRMKEEGQMMKERREYRKITKEGEEWDDL